MASKQVRMWVSRRSSRLVAVNCKGVEALLYMKLHRVHF